MAVRVLIAEDNNECRTVLGMMFAHFGCNVITAVDGLDAIEKAVSMRPDLIMMDLRMPKLGGLEATKRLKADPLTRDIPIVVCSAMGRDAFGYAKLLETPVEFVQKPIRVEKVSQLVRKYVAKDDQPPSGTDQDKKITDVLGAWRVLGKIKATINDPSAPAGLAEAHKFDSVAAFAQREHDAKRRDDNNSKALPVTLPTRLGKFLAGFFQLVYGARDCLDILANV